MTTSVLQHQSSTTTKTPGPNSMPFSASGQWLKEGFGLFRKSPLKILFFAFLPMLFSGLIQLLPAPFSIIASKWFGAAALTLLWPLLHHIYRTGQFSFKSAFSAGNWLSVALFGLSGILMASMQLCVAMLVIGADAPGLLLHMEPTEVARWQLGVVFASAVPVVLLLAFAPAKILLENQNVMTAISASIRLSVKAWKPLTIVGAGYALQLFSAPYFIPAVIVIGPLMSCIMYVGYQQITAIYE